MRFKNAILRQPNNKPNIFVIAFPRRTIGLLTFLIISLTAQAQTQTAPAPLFRDPIYDGAADPIVVYNRKQQEWTMFYTQRRANLPLWDVAYCYGTAIGVATSQDHGKTWNYTGTLDIKIDDGHNTFWAPEIIYDNGTYHLFVTYIKGIYNHWAGKARLVHFTSSDLKRWKFKGSLKLEDDIIDPTLMKLADGKWHIWYKKNSQTFTAASNNLSDWKLQEKPAITGAPHEGPKIFKFKDYYWMITDEWRGQRVHRSTDGLTWETQGLILDKAGKRQDDTPQGAHADVVVTENNAYIVYFTHPGRVNHTNDGGQDKNGNLTYSAKRSSIQVANLEFENGTLTCDRDKPFNFWLP